MVRIRILAIVFFLLFFPGFILIFAKESLSRGIKKIKLFSFRCCVGKTDFLKKAGYPKDFWARGYFFFWEKIPMNWLSIGKTLWAYFLGLTNFLLFINPPKKPLIVA